MKGLDPRATEYLGSVLVELFGQPVSGWPS
jgi:hypothetical protein